MAATPYKPLSWADNEPIFTSKLRDMAQNDQWLFENTARMHYNAYDVKRDEGVKVACGLHPFEPAGSGIQQGVVYFDSFFSTACNPIVVLGVVHQGEVRIHLGVKGINTPFPDYRGFEILGGSDQLDTKNNRMTKRFWVNWIAMGF